MAEAAGPVLVAGAGGQLARALTSLGTIAGRPVVALGRPALDLTDGPSLAAAMARVAPSLVINAAAYTAVDQAESEPEAAFAVNAAGAGALARLAAAAGIRIVHVSSDYVFDGTGSAPLPPDTPVRPLGAYGASKAEGERLVRAANPDHLIVRTSWVYGEHGHNFLNTMLRLAETRDEVSVVADQHGAPTYVADLARALAAMAARPAVSGTFHACNAGATTWHGFAAEIFRLAAAAGARVPRLTAIATADYPTPARRPAWSVLDCSATEAAFGLRLPDWRDGLARAMAARLAG